MITDKELLEIERTANSARAAKWTSFIEGRDFTSGSSFIMVGQDENRDIDIELIGATIEDQDFIASARQDIPKLIKEIRRLRKLLKNNGTT